MDNAQGSLYFG